MKMIQQRISAGGIVVVNGKILLVHHYRLDGSDFWVLPGGGIEANEGIFRAAERELLEETSLRVKAERIAYVEEFMDTGKYVCKFWVYCSLDQGDLSSSPADADAGFGDAAGFFSKEELTGLNVFPAVVRAELWQDLAGGFAAIKYLGYKQDDA